MGCAKLPLENNPLHIWGLHILWHKVKSKHQNGNRCWARKSCSTLVYIPCFHPSSLSLPLCPLLWPNIMSGGWKNNSKTMVVQVENCAVKISNQSQPIRMNLQWTCSQETLRDESPKRTKDTKNTDRDGYALSWTPGCRGSRGVASHQTNMIRDCP